MTSPPSPPCAWATDGRRGHGLTQGQRALWLGQWAWWDVLSPRNHRGSASRLGVALLLLAPGVRKALEQGGWKEHGRGRGRAGHQAQIQLDRELGRGWLETWPPELGRRVHQRSWSHPKAHRLPAVRLGVTQCPLAAPRNPPGSVPAMPSCAQASPLHCCGSEQLCVTFLVLSLSAAEASEWSPGAIRTWGINNGAVQAPGTQRGGPAVNPRAPRDGPGTLLAHLLTGMDLVLFEAEIVGVPPASWSPHSVTRGLLVPPVARGAPFGGH